MEEPKTSSHTNSCRNCTYPILQSASYCSNCGQKNTDGRISISSFFSSFFSTVFNLESKFFQTMGHVFIPGKLTVEYFQGRHKRYFHPVRFFIVTALLLIGAMGLLLTEGAFAFHVHKRALQQVQSENFIENMEGVAQSTLDKFPDNASLKPAFDTLYKDLKAKTIDLRDSIDMDNFVMTGAFEELQINISNKDFLNLNTEELLAKYKIEGTINRLVFKQKIKLFKDEKSFGPFVLGNSLWIVLLMMPFLALILKILYTRHGYYYVEHLVFSFHTHAFAFLLFAIIGLLIHLGVPVWIVAIGFFCMAIYLYVALLRVYGQGKLKTLAKQLIIHVSYFFLFMFFFVFGLVSSMAIF